MPTNKLWLEHTEKAAWDSVQALREKIAELEKRLARMAPPTTGWQPLLDALDSAKVELGLPSDSYAELLADIVAQLRREQTERRSLEQELAELRSASLVSEVPSGPSAAPRPAFDSEDDIAPARTTRDEFVRRLQKRYEASTRQGALDLDELLDAIDTKVGDLSDLDDRALADAAVDLAALAMRVAKTARHRRE